MSNQEMGDKLVITERLREERHKRERSSEPKIKAEVVRSKGEYCFKTLLFIITYKPQHKAESNTRMLPPARK